MKQFILLLLLLCGLVACNKDRNNNLCDTTTPDTMPIYSAGTQEHGSITACRNGREWEASGVAYRYEQKDDIFQLSGATYCDGLLRDVWGISEVPLQIGTYYVYRRPFTGGFIGTSTAGVYIRASDGDVTEEVYRIDESQYNYVVVTKLDTINNKVSGYFELHFVVQQPKHGEQNSDELYFKNGSFEVDIID